MTNALLTGPPLYVARGPWRPIAALAVAVIIQAGLQFLAGVIGTLATAAGLGVPLDSLTESQILIGVLVFLLLSQAAVIGLTWVAAGLFGGRRREVLQAHLGVPPAHDIAIALVGLALVLGAFNALVYFLRPDLLLADMAQFQTMVQQPYLPLTALAIGIGAPISEELLFRGFLLSALAKGRLGFWPAALIVNVVWTVFHFGYSIVGLVEVFVGGLYLSWLLWRSGTIWLPMIAHMATNIVFLAVIATYPLG